jgi:predicted nucleic acid-binding protein
MIVVDANIVVYTFYDTSYTPLARQAYARDSTWVVPDIWRAEVLNALVMEVRRGRIEHPDAVLVASNAIHCLRDAVRVCDYATVLRIADEARLTAYDAHYVALARELETCLLTEDRKILKNCADVAQSLESYLGSGAAAP